MSNEELMGRVIQLERELATVNVKLNFSDMNNKKLRRGLQNIVDEACDIRHNGSLSCSIIIGIVKGLVEE